MPCMAGSAVANATVGLRFADRVALRAAAGDRGRPLEFGQRVGWPLHVARVKLLCNVSLLGRQTCFAVDCRPRRRRVPAARELLIDLFVAAAAIGRSNMRGDDEAVVIL